MASERSSNGMEAHTKWRLKLVNLPSESLVSRPKVEYSNP